MISLMTMILLYGPINKTAGDTLEKNNKIICMELRIRSKATPRTQTISKTWAVGLKNRKFRGRERNDISVISFSCGDFPADGGGWGVEVHLTQIRESHDLLTVLLYGHYEDGVCYDATRKPDAGDRDRREET